MPICVHLTFEDNVAHIKRVGIKAMHTRWELKGVYCMPVLPNFYASHQWLRELRRHRKRGYLVAVDFKIPDEEKVLVGHYGQAHQTMTVAEASKLIRSQADPQGFEIVLMRSVKASEIHKVRGVPQVIGWRYSPGSKGRKPCTCDFCALGDQGARSRQRREAAKELKASKKEKINSPENLQA